MPETQEIVTEKLELLRVCVEKFRERIPESRRLPEDVENFCNNLRDLLRGADTANRGVRKQIEKLEDRIAELEAETEDLEDQSEAFKGELELVREDQLKDKEEIYTAIARVIEECCDRDPDATLREKLRKLTRRLRT